MEYLNEEKEAVPRKQTRSVYRAVKKVFDVCFSLICLIGLIPLFLIIAAAIRIDSPGPVFFVQTRVGKDGKPFRMVKFHSMCADAEEKLDSLQKLNERDGPVFKIKHDPRVTRVGHILRKTCLDELPQLFNILRGEMSFVGPRPALPKEVEQYTPYQRGRLAATPGLTCYWQVSKDTCTTFDEWVALDLKYIREQSVRVDLRLIFATIRIVFSGKGAD